MPIGISRLGIGSHIRVSDYYDMYIGILYIAYKNVYVYMFQ